MNDKILKFAGNIVVILVIITVCVGLVWVIARIIEGI